MFLDPKEVFKPKISLIEVVRRHKIDFETKLQDIWSLYAVSIPTIWHNLAQELHILAQVTKGCVTFLKTAFVQNDRLISYVAGFK